MRCRRGDRSDDHGSAAQTGACCLMQIDSTKYSIERASNQKHRLFDTIDH